MERLWPFPTRVEGWLYVAEYAPRQNSIMYIPELSWLPKFCLLLENESLFWNLISEEASDLYPSPAHLTVSRLDGGRGVFCRYWGWYDNSGPNSPVLNAGTPDTPTDSIEEAWLSRGRTSSNVTQDGENGSSGNRFLNFLSKKGILLKRTKSITKLDRARKNSQPDLHEVIPSCLPVGPASKNPFMKRSLSLGRINRRSAERFSFGKGTSPGPNSAAATPSQHLRQSMRSGSPRRLPPTGLRHPPPGPNSVSAESGRTRSHDCLYLPQPASPHFAMAQAVDSGCQVRALHPSLVGGQRYCFGVTTSEGDMTRYYAAQSAAERNKWIRALRRTSKPNLENERHRENSLRLWIQEAKNTAPKRRYFCAVCLNQTLYARTTTKQMSDMLFWGEEFDLNNLPDISVVTINLYREGEARTKTRGKKERCPQNVLIAYVSIPVSDIRGRCEMEQWYATRPPPLTASAKRNPANDLPLIRIKARYQSVDILPLACYQPLREFLSCDYLPLMGSLETMLTVKAKEDLASAMVNILHKQGRSAHFLTDLVVNEVQELDNDTMAFRGNSLATKAMECFLKLVGEKYLHDTLFDFVTCLLHATEDCECDPQKLGLSAHVQLEQNRNHLTMFVEMVWAKILASVCYFPIELRRVFAAIRQCMEQRHRSPNFCDNLISACIFLRFICPAILSPSLFGLTQEFPSDPRVVRNFTLVAKSILNLANFSRFGGKEKYMCFMNLVVERELINMQQFLRQISMSSSVQHITDDVYANDSSPQQQFPLESTLLKGGGSSCHCEDYIDLGYELAVIHLQLTEALEKFPHQCISGKLGKLKLLLDDVTYMLHHGENALPLTPSSDLQQFLPAVQSHVIAECPPSPTPPATPIAVTRTASASISSSSSSTRQRPPSPARPLQQADKPSSLQACVANVDAVKVEESWSRIVAMAQSGRPDLVDGLYDFGCLMSDLEIDEASMAAKSDERKRRGESPTVAPLNQQESTVPRQQQFYNPTYATRVPPVPTKATLEEDSASLMSVRTATPPPPQTSATSSPRNLPPSGLTRPVHTRSSTASSSSSSASSSSASSASASVSASASSTSSASSSNAPPAANSQPKAAGPPAANPNTSSLGHRRRSSVGQPNVRMGVSSVQMAQAAALQERRSKEDYETEINALSKKLEGMRARLMSTEDQLAVFETTNQQLVETCRVHVDENQLLVREQQHRDEQMRDLIQRLVSVEDELRREHSYLQGEMQDKDRVISAQERRINSLDAANARLMAALDQLKALPANFASMPISNGSAIIPESPREDGPLDEKKSLC